MSPASLRKADRCYSNVPLLEEEERQIRLLLNHAVKNMELLESDIAELEKMASWYKIELTQLQTKHHRSMSPTRISAFLASVVRRLYPGEGRWSKPPGEEKSVRWSLAGVKKKIRFHSKQLAQLDEQIVRFRIAVAPHKKLPEDVLRYIFTLSCADEPKASLVLSQVCSAWRRLASDIPLLFQERALILNRGAIRRRQSRPRRWLQTVTGVLRAGTYLDGKSLSYGSLT